MPSYRSLFGIAGRKVSGQAQYVTNGTYSWVCPADVTSVCVVCIGPGRAFGGGLGWKNNISVTPGQSYTVQVGIGGTNVSSAACTDSWFINSSTVRGGHGGNAAGTFTGDGGGNGGTNTGNAGGGAGGYAGAGGTGASSATTGFVISNASGTAGSGGGGGGGGMSYDYRDGLEEFGPPISYTGAGGGTGLFGQGSNGAGGVGSNLFGGGGGGGSSGGNGGNSTPGLGAGGAYGGGGSGTLSGAVRIIWGAGRAFPSTNTGNL